jgi:hypothetical protein
MVRVKSDGNGGSHINVKPQWVSAVVALIVLLAGIAGGFINYGSTKAAQIKRIEQLENSAVHLETGRLENRALIDMLLIKFVKFDERQRAMSELQRREFDWLRERLK